MPNAIKYSTSAQTLALKKGNYWIGTGDVGKGPTSTTDYYNGITPPSGGYTIYLNKASGGPSIYTAANDADLISLSNTIAGQTFATAAAALAWFATQTDKMVFDIDYEPIVTNGLVLTVDAGFTPSYPTTGTTWYDLIGSNNGTLTNGPTFSSANGGTIVFDGTDDWVSIPQQSSLINASQFTLCAWMKRSTTASRCLVSAGNFGFASNGTMIALNLGGAGSAQSFTIQNPNNTSATVSGTNTGSTAWIYYSGVFDGTQTGDSNRAKFYFNAALQTCTYGTIPATTGNAATPLAVGSIQSISNYYQTGNTGVVQLYNRALSAAEILQNYNAQKARYGL